MTKQAIQEKVQEICQKAIDAAFAGDFEEWHSAKINCTHEQWVDALELMVECGNASWSSESKRSLTLSGLSLLGKPFWQGTIAVSGTVGIVEAGVRFEKQN